MNGDIFYRMTISFTRFNTKHTAEFSSFVEAKAAAERIDRQGIWVTDKMDKHTLTYWGPASIGKIVVTKVEPEDEKNDRETTT